jgi:hypothetical protein
MAAYEQSLPSGGQWTRAEGDKTRECVNSLTVGLQREPPHRARPGEASHVPGSHGRRRAPCRVSDPIALRDDLPALRRQDARCLAPYAWRAGKASPEASFLIRGVPFVAVPRTSC